jgi:hypothetical protein
MRTRLRQRQLRQRRSGHRRRAVPLCCRLQRQRQRSSRGASVGRSPARDPPPLSAPGPTKSGNPSAATRGRGLSPRGVRWLGAVSARQPCRGAQPAGRFLGSPCRSRVLTVYRSGSLGLGRCCEAVGCGMRSAGFCHFRALCPARLAAVGRTSPLPVSFPFLCLFVPHLPARASCACR